MSASSDKALLACSLSAWKGEPKCCRWCNSDLIGRRSRWCSDDCATEFGRNHWWTSASVAARRRDGWKCVRCGETGHQVHHTTPLHTLSTTAITTIYPWREERRVKHGDSGCWHHLDGLETLCDGCHHAEHHPPPADDGQLALDVTA